MLAIYGYAKQPRVTGVEVVSTPSVDFDDDGTPETYGQGENICVQLTFDAAVTVTGTPWLRIDMDLDETWGTKTADYESGTGTTKLTFAYEVVNNNRSTKGIAVLVNTLALNSGTIVAASDSTIAANLAHSGLGHQTNHEVHGNTQAASTKTCAQQLAGSRGAAPAAPDTTPPRLTRATVSGDTLRLAFDERLDPASVPAATDFAVTVDGATAAPSAVGLSGSTVTLTLAEAVEPGTAVTVSYTPGGSPLRDAAGNDVAAFTDYVVSHGAPEAQQRAFAGALASVAAQTVAGALDNIGARLGDAVPAAGLSLAGRHVPFGRSGAGGFDGYSPGGGESRGMDAGALLGSSAFSLALGAAEGEPGFDAGALRWGVWGRGDYGAFEGRAGAGARYKGETRTGWLGADAPGVPFDRLMAGSPVGYSG